jgi:hypothetical protein
MGEGIKLIIAAPLAHDLSDSEFGALCAIQRWNGTQMISRSNTMAI